MLRAEDLTVGYPGRLLCQSLNVTMQPGECWGIMGRNGSGKSTLLHALGGVRKPLSGGVKIGEQPVTSMRKREQARKIGLLLQEESGVFFGTVREYVMLGRYPHHAAMGGWNEEDEAQVRQALERMELTSLATRMVSTLSGGERQRARIAMVLAQSPEIYGLDEPLLHLDICHQAAVMKLLKEVAISQYKTVVMVLHDTLWASRYCDHVLLLYGDGRTASGTTEALLDKGSLEELYQCNMQALRINNEIHYVPQ